MKKIIFLLMTVAIVAMINPGFAFMVPRDDSKTKYLYVFGPSGNPDLGAEEAEQVLYINVPKDTDSKVYIAVYDADTGGNLDLNPDFNNAWDTVTEFAVYGKNDELLGKEQFAESKVYNRSYFNFGPYSKDQGEEVDDYYRFKLIARTISGKDENLYSVRIFPDDAEAFAYKFTFRLLEQEGDKMYFYPEVPAGTRKIIVENYDIDINGGNCALFDPESNKWYKIKDSQSAKWAETPIEIDAKQTKRLEYVVTKKTQKYANAGIRVKDEQGNLLPIYFRKSRPLAIAKPVAVAQPREDLFPPRKCNDKFIFDATKSYDPGNKKLTYYWDFGDGTTSSEPVVTHVYDKVGEYTVKLLVRNDSGLECDNSQTSQVIKVNSAPRVFVTRPQKICPGQQVTFDASASKDNTPDALTYHWDFGDGTTAEGTRVTKVYKDSGSYRINLTVDDNQGTPCSSVTKGMIIDVSAPPLADAGKDVEACLANNQEYKVTFYAGRPKNIDTSNWTYRWDFGDGTTGEGRTVSHIYQRGGTYNVQLVVDDGLSSPCSSSRDTATVTLSRQPVAHAGEDILTDVGSEVSFDGSGSYCENNCNLEHTWDFGDGSVKAHGARVAHTYKKGGKYTALLTVDDGRGKSCSSATDSLIVNVNSRPTAELEKVGRPCVNTEVDFDASASRDPDGNQLKYTWDFGDGTVIEDGPRVRHVYKKDGEYIISVTVDDQVGTEASKNTRSIKIRVNTPPVANAGPNLVCCVNKRNIFDGSASSDANGDDLTYTWDFGDGVTATGKTVSHIYTKQGRYTVILTVNDNSQTACDTATDSFVALVSDKPVSVMDIRK